MDLKNFEGDYVADVFSRDKDVHYTVREMGIGRWARCGNHLGKIFSKVLMDMQGNVALTVDSFIAQLILSLPVIAVEFQESLCQILVISCEDKDDHETLTYKDAKRLKLDFVTRLVFATIEVNKEQILSTLEIMAANKSLFDEIKKKAALIFPGASKEEIKTESVESVQNSESTLTPEASTPT